MTPDQLPIGQTITVAQTAQFRNTVERISEDTVELIYYDQTTGDETLKVHARVDGSSELVAFDRIYWSVQVDGRAATERDFDDILRKRTMAFGVDPAERRLSFFTRERRGG